MVGRYALPSKKVLNVELYKYLTRADQLGSLNSGFTLNESSSLIDAQINILGNDLKVRLIYSRALTKQDITLCSPYGSDFAFINIAKFYPRSMYLSSDNVVRAQQITMQIAVNTAIVNLRPYEIPIYINEPNATFNATRYRLKLLDVDACTAQTSLPKMYEELYNIYKQKESYGSKNVNRV